MIYDYEGGSTFQEMSVKDNSKKCAHENEEYF